MAEKELMLTKKEIMAAVEESQLVKRKYPAFWKFYEMIMAMNTELQELQELMEKKK